MALIARGYFIKQGDKTSCGGVVTAGNQGHKVTNKATAREGDAYICGLDGKEYYIKGGMPYYRIENKLAAGTEHSKGTCKCNCAFIPSDTSVTYGFNIIEEDEDAEEKEQALLLKLKEDLQKTAEERQRSAEYRRKTAEEQRPPVDAGFCILPDETTPKKYQPWLFIGPIDEVQDLFLQYNPERQKKPGSILIVVDPAKDDSNQLRTLIRVRDTIDKALEPLTMEEAKLLHDNRAAVDMFSSQIYFDALGTSGSILGAISEAGSGYYEEINQTLKEIQDLYKNTYASNNRIISGQEFFGQRQRLFDKLNTILNKYSKEQLNLSQYEDIKKALGLSTSSIMHKWNQSGVADIEGYASYIEKSAKLIKVMRTTGYVGLGLDFAAYTENVYDACSKGREDACKKAALVEYGKFGTKQALSFAAGSVSGWAARSACLWVLGLATSEVGGIGAGLCLVTGIAASIGGGNLVEGQGEKAGEKGGEIIYEKLFNGE